MSDIENALATDEPLLATWERPAHAGLLRLFRVSGTSLQKHAEQRVPAIDRESLTDRLVARGVRVGSYNFYTGHAWVIDDAGLSVWRHQRQLVERARPPANTKSVQMVETSDGGKHGVIVVRFALDDGTFDSVAEENDPDAGSVGTKPLWSWAVAFGRELAAWSGVPLEIPRLGTTYTDHLLVIRAVTGLLEQLGTGSGEITVPIEASDFALYVPPDRHSLVLRIMCADRRNLAVKLKDGDVAQLRAYLRRVTTLHTIDLARSGARSQKKESAELQRLMYAVLACLLGIVGVYGVKEAYDGIQQHRRQAASQGVIEKHRASAGAQADKLAKLAKIVAAAPPTIEERWSVPSSVIDFRSGSPSYNAAVVSLGGLTRRCGAHSSSPDDWFNPPFDDPSWLCISRDGNSTGADALEREFSQLEQMKFLVVVRISQLERPQSDRVDRSGHLRKRFTPGRVVGDAVLYEVATGAPLGAFRYDVSNEPRERDHTSDDYELASNLTLHVKDAIETRLAKLTPVERP